MVIKASILLLLVALVSAQYNLNNQPITTLNDISFITPITGSMGRVSMYTYSLKTYYDVDGYSYEFKAVDASGRQVTPTYLLTGLNVIGVCNAITHLQNIKYSSC